MIDIGDTGDAFLPKSECIMGKGSTKLAEIIPVGSKVEVQIIDAESIPKKVSLKAIQLEKAWAEMNEIYHEDSSFEVVVTEVRKGGAMVDFKGLITAFLPGSHALSFPPTVGEKMWCKVLEMDPGVRLVVSNKNAVQEKYKEKIQ